MIALDVKQGTKAWFSARAGCVTASRVADAIAMLKKGGESAARRNYKMELLCERLTGKALEHYVTPAMEYGIEKEPLARTAYELLTGRDVSLVGFVCHPTIKMSGASPDGLVGDEGLAEFKVPNTLTHLEYWIAGVVPEDYQPQMLWQMACCERRWCDFVSHDPRLPEEYRTFIVRMERDDKRIAEMEAGVVQFLSEVDDLLLKVRERNGGESFEEAKLKQSLAAIGQLGITAEDARA